MTSIGPVKRCAIYTRKSTSHRLDAPFNSLKMQRELCSAYVRSQSHRNWQELSLRYDDGGFSGGSLHRPALRELIADIEAGRIDTVIVYKIDRLSRSLNDFVRLIDLLDRYGVDFVSVTQTFDTSDSMGRLVLNILLTFAQFEREIMSDRVRDKKAALKTHGLFVGGTPPYGYKNGEGGRLKLKVEEAEIVREIFRRFTTETATAISRDLTGRGIRTPTFVTKLGKTKGGHPLYVNRILSIIRNPVYTGHVVHRGDWIPAKFEALVTREQFDRVQQVASKRFPGARDPVRNFLLGILFDEHGRRMRTQRGTGRSRHLRYYRSEYSGWARNGGARRIAVSADAVESLSLAIICSLLTDRVRLKDVILSMGLYSDEIRRALTGGHAAAARVGRFDQERKRSFALALIKRAEVTSTSLRIFISCHELTRFLSWKGVGFFTADPVTRPRQRDIVHEEFADADLISGHHRLERLLKPRPLPESQSDPHLVDLLDRASTARQLALSNRELDETALAKLMKVGTTHFGRLLRLNYLAPDIQTAIMDGTHPTSLSRRKLLSTIPLDWDQQRQLLGFRT